MLRNNFELPEGVLWVSLASPLPGSSTCHLGLGSSYSPGSGALNCTYQSRRLLPEQECFASAQGHTTAKKQINFFQLSVPDSAFLLSALYSGCEVTRRYCVQRGGGCHSQVSPD